MNEEVSELAWEVVRYFDANDFQLEIEDDETGDIRWFQIPSDLEDMLRDLKDALVEAG